MNKESKIISILSNKLALSIKELLNAYGFKNLDNFDDNKIFQAYFCLREQLVPSQKRRIVKAKDFTCPFKYKDGLKFLELNITNGLDLTKFQSRKIVGKHKRLVRDHLFSDWGIYHFHLSTEMENKANISSMKSSNDVLFAYIKKDSFYELKILPHGDSFANRELIEVIHNNWPELIESQRVKDNTGVSDKDKIKKLRDKSVNYSLTLKDGATYAVLNNGLMVNGDDAKSCFLLINLKKSLKIIAKEIVNKNLDINSIQVRRRFGNIESNQPLFLRCNFSLEIADYSRSSWVNFAMETLSTSNL